MDAAKTDVSLSSCYQRYYLSIYFQYTQYIFYPFISAQLGLPPARTH